MLRYAPHALLIIFVMIMPLAVSILMALSAFGLYMAYVWYAFYLFAPEFPLSFIDTARLARDGVADLFSFG